MTIRHILDRGLQTKQFEIIFKASKTEDEDISERRTLYECENIETASYVVAKIKT